MAFETTLPDPQLPTFKLLGATPPQSLDPFRIAREWIDSFARCISQHDVSALTSSLLYSEPWWRDIFALTWDLRTFRGLDNIATFLRDCVPSSGFGDITLTKATYDQVLPDVAWVLVYYSFATKVATGCGAVRLVYCPEGWRALSVSTHLDGLKDHPERIGALYRDLGLEQGSWTKRRREALEFAEDPEVLVIGAGQGGLGVAARLKHLGVRCLLVEKNARVGDNWRSRYDRLSLHDPIWSNDLPYLPFPASWPAFPNAAKIANWFEFYADALELDVWTSTEAVQAVRDDVTQKWTVTVRRGGVERTLHVAHVVLAQGFTFKKTVFPGQEAFSGQMIHSSKFKSAETFAGKKVVVIGACTSAHDIASDCADYGADVTMVQRSSTYVLSMKGVLMVVPESEWNNVPLSEVELKIHSLPLGLHWPFGSRIAAHIRELDRDILAGLERAGYTVANGGPNDRGVYRPFVERCGGYYVDVGACQRIIDGQIKVKSGAGVDRITERSVALKDGSELPADIIIVATGFDDVRVTMRKLLGDEMGAQIPPVWGLNAEDELRGVWRELESIPGMWIMMGHFSWSRYFSKFVALQIKARLKGIHGPRYAAPVR